MPVMESDIFGKKEMATTTTTVEVRQTLSLKLPHHDPLHLPIKRFMTIDGLLKSHAAVSDQKPLICYPKSGAADFEEHTAADIDRYTDSAVQYYLANGLHPADPSAAKAPVVALLATTSFEFVVSIFALNRLGWSVLFLSTRLTAPAYARLLELANCRTVILPENQKQLVVDICEDRPGCVAVPILQRQDYRDCPPAPVYQRHGVDPAVEGRKMAWILHSSGSTGFPKPIFLSNLACLANCRKSFGLRCFCISPLFHSHGLFELGRAFYTKAPMYLGNHAMPVTAQNLTDALEVAKPQQVTAVPYVIQLLAEKAEGVQLLAKAKLVLFGGSSCPDDLGDRLVANGVNLVANYGSTETGQIMTSFRPPGDKEWQYLRLLKPAADFTLMDEIAPGVFECVGLDGLPSKGPSNSKPPYSTSNPENSFRTADLFTRHPDPKKSNHYKYLSRLDDRITLVNGEKVLPIPIEGQIRQDELVQEAAVFGFQRTVPGLLIFRSNEKGSELNDQQFLSAVWPSVEKANSNAESFSRIPKELVVVIGPQVTCPRTDKGTFIRAQVYQQFANEIKQAYEAYDAAIDGAVGLLQLAVPELQQWLLAQFAGELDIHISSPDTDIFSAGVDSLQTMRIWRMLKRDLDLGKGGASMSQNIVFEKATVRQLARYLYQLRTGEVEKEAEDDIQNMRELVDRYSNFVRHLPAQRQDLHEKGQVVVITGATGNLGAFTVAELARRSDVTEIWALVRAPGQAAAGARLMHALTSRSIHLTDDQHSKVHAVPSDLSKANLGLDQHVLDHLLGSLTHVIHSAWAVNFNLGVCSFEDQHIRGTYNLINTCLRSRQPKPASFFFCSSVSVASATPKPATIHETAVEDFAHAQRIGYGRSKLVSEHITRNAMCQTGMNARVLRVGQLSGDTSSGYWNETEAIALMIRSALTTGCLPELDERPSWLPVDLCAKAIVELSLPSFRTSPSSDPNLVYQLVNPSTFSFKHDLLPVLKACSSMPHFDIVSPSDWLERLGNSEQDPVKNPSIKLIDFWRGKYGSGVASSADDDEPAGLTFETSRTVQDCPTLGLVGDPVSMGLADRYVKVWLARWLK